MDEIKLSVALFFIILILIGFVVGWPMAARTYLVLFLIGNLLASPATVMMLAGHREKDTPTWKRVAVPAATILLVAPSFPVMLPVNVVKDMRADAAREKARAERRKKNINSRSD